MASDNADSQRVGAINANLLLEREGDVLSKYEIISIIGEGSMGSVSKARVKEEAIGGSAFHADEGCFGCFRPKSKKPAVIEQKDRRKHDNIYALKTIILSRVTPDFIEELRNEINILRTMDHPNIVKAFEVFEKKREIFIVMEICSGGDLYRRLPYSESDSAKITTKLLSAIKYMHDHDIVHRDLKFENIMFESNKTDAEIKVIDFGLSKKFLPSDRVKTMTEGVGTIYTMAPQVLQGVYTSQADLWSVGVITFMLLSSQKPFHHKRRKRVIDKIMRGRYTFSSVLWDQVTDESKAFVSGLLVVDPKSRMTAAEALKHEWLQEQYKLSDRRPTEDLMDQVKENLVAYKDTSELKKLALNVIAHKSSTEEIMDLRQCFDQYDSGNDGYITFKEFQNALKESNYAEADIEKIFKSIDVNENGHIMYTEFVAATLEARGAIEEERLAEAFDRLDSDDSGYISFENLRSLLGSEWNQKRIENLISEADTNHDGKISYEEFKVFFRKNTSEVALEAVQLGRESTFGESEAELVGLDAFIPGGKYDNPDEKAT